MELMRSSSHQRSVVDAEQAMPRILETERRYVSSPETARRAASGGAVVFRPESALSRSRPSSRLAELDVDGGGDETGQSRPLHTPGGPGRSTPTDYDSEEERRELEERLKTLRLDLASELQSAGSGRSGTVRGSGSVTPFTFSRTASRLGYASEVEHTDSLLSSPRAAPRHLKPLMTMEISADRFRRLQMAHAHSGTHDEAHAVPYINGELSAVAQQQHQVQVHDGELSVAAQQQYQDRVHDFFELEPETMKLRSRGPSSHTPSTDARMPTPDARVDSHQESSTATTDPFSRRRKPVPEHIRRESVLVVKELLGAIIEDAVEAPPVATETLPTASDSVPPAIHVQQLKCKGEPSGQIAVPTVADDEQKTNIQMPVTEAVQAAPIQAAVWVQTPEAIGSLLEPAGTDEEVDYQQQTTEALLQPSSVRVHALPPKTYEETDDREPGKGAQEQEKVESERRLRLSQEIFEIYAVTSKCPKCQQPVSPSMQVCTRCAGAVSESGKSRKRNQEIKVGKWGSFLSTHDIKAAAKNPAPDMASPRVWSPANFWGGEEQREKILQLAASEKEKAVTAGDNPVVGKQPRRVLTTTRRAVARKRDDSAMTTAGADVVGRVFKVCGAQGERDKLMVLTSFVHRNDDNLLKPLHYAGQAFGHRTESDPVRGLLNAERLYACEHTTVYASSVYSTDGDTPVVFASFGSLPQHPNAEPREVSFQAPESNKSDAGRKRASGFVKVPRLGQHSTSAQVLRSYPTPTDITGPSQGRANANVWRGDLKAKLRRVREAEMAATRAAAEASCLYYGAKRHSLKMSPAPAMQAPLWPVAPTTPASMPRVPLLLLKQGLSLDNDELPHRDVEAEGCEAKTDLRKDLSTTSPSSSQLRTPTIDNEKVSSSPFAPLTLPRTQRHADVDEFSDTHHDALGRDEHTEFDLVWQEEASPLSLLAKEMDQDGSKRSSAVSRSNSARRHTPKALWQENVARASMRPHTATDSRARAAAAAAVADSHGETGTPASRRGSSAMQLQHVGAERSTRYGAMSARQPRGRPIESGVQEHQPHERRIQSARAHVHTGLAIKQVQKMEKQWLERQEQSSMGEITTISRLEEPLATRAWKTSAEIGRLADWPRQTRTIHHLEQEQDPATYSGTERNMPEHTNDQERELQLKLFEDFAAHQMGPTGSKVMGPAEFVASLQAANVVWEAGFGEALAKATGSGKALSHAAALQVFKACSLPVRLPDQASTSQSCSPVAVLDCKGFLRACAAINCRLDVTVGAFYARILGSQAARVLAITREAAQRQGSVLRAEARTDTAGPVTALHQDATTCSARGETRVNPDILLHLFQVDAARALSERPASSRWPLLKDDERLLKEAWRRVPPRRTSCHHPSPRERSTVIGLRPARPSTTVARHVDTQSPHQLAAYAASSLDALYALQAAS